MALPMRALVRPLLCALCCAAVLVGGAWAFARWQRGVLAELDLPGAGHALMSALHEREALDAHWPGVYDRLVGKQRVVNELLDGRLSLREAGDEFRRMNAEKAEAEGKDQHAASDMADLLSDEAVYGSLMAWVNASASVKPGWPTRAAHLQADVDSTLHRPQQGA